MLKNQTGNPWKRLPTGPLVAPSLLACDFGRVAEQIAAVTAAGAGVLHVDIMDGHFVPNLSMGPGFVKKIRPYATLPLDVHVMVSDPAYYIERFAEAGADSITFHVEATRESQRLIGRLRELGLGAAVTLKPGTPAQAVRDVIAAVDMVLVMTVEPGYGGQKFMEPMLEKVAAIRSWMRDDQRLEVDGGINPVTGAMCAARGADVFVAGEDIFGAADVVKAVKDLQDATTKAAGNRQQAAGKK